MTKDDWHKLRMECLKRDNFTCLRCEKKSRQGMQAHHLIPRNLGGADDVSNLVTLCNSCHDFVEIEEYRTKAEIIGSYDALLMRDLDAKQFSSEIREYSFTRPSWHKYVYGGARHSD